MNRQRQLDEFSLALHRKAIAALHRDPELRSRARDALNRWRKQAGPTRSDALWIEWEHLLDGELTSLESAALAESEHGTLMRSVSPLGCLVDQHERTLLLKQARDRARLQ